MPERGAAGAARDSAPRRSFGARAAEAISAHGPLCVGIDAHPALLESWGCPRTPAGLLRFSLRVVEALEGRVAALKPQVAWYEAYGSAGIGVLEQVLAACREAGLLSIADAKRGDIGSTMAAYAHTWLADESSLAADAVTLSPYLGAGSLTPALELAEATGRGTFVLALTSNPEGASLQRIGGRDSVAAGVAGHIAARNTEFLDRRARAADASSAKYDEIMTGPHGLVIGATTGASIAEAGVDLRSLRGPILAPGYGAQGAAARDLATMFAQVAGQVLVNSARGILRAGPGTAALQDAADTANRELRAALPMR